MVVLDGGGELRRHAARSGEHDDLVIAVALAVWGGVTMSEY